jgi:hypothetical protein
VKSLSSNPVVSPVLQLLLKVSGSRGIILDAMMDEDETGK